MNEPEPDTSDIPEVGEDWFKKARLSVPEPRPFCLKPQDQLAVGAISKWIANAIRAKVSPNKIAKAKMHRNAFRAWQKANPDKVKWPD